MMMVFDVRTCSTPRCPWAPPLSSSKAPSSCSNAGARARPRRPGPWRKTWRKMGQHHGKPWKTMEKPWKTMENHGKTMEMFIWKVYFHRNSFWGPRNQAGISTEKNFYFCGTRIWMILQEGMDNKQITERFMDGTIVWNDCFSGS